MKKLSKLIALAISLAAVTFASCTNGFFDAVVEDPNSFNKTNLTITVSGDSDYLVFPEAPEDGARTIVPAALDGANLTFYYWGENKLNGSDTSLATPKEISFYAVSGSYGRVGSVELDLPTSQWELYLAAVETSKVASLSLTNNVSDVSILKAKSELLATATVDMRYNEKVSFYLTPNTGSGATGDVSLTVGTNWTITAPYTLQGNMHFALKSLKDGSTIITPNDTKKELSTSEIEAMNNKVPADPNYKLTGIAAGIYNFEVSFKRDNEKTYIWSDTIIILPNQTTSQTIIVPNIIGLKPAAPEKFTARYLEPESYSSGYYDVQFVWDDKSNNEHYFQLDLMDVPDDSSIQTQIEAFIAANNDTNWDALVATNKVKVEKITNTIYSDPRFIDGSLNANSISVTLSLPLGTRYFVRLSAANDGNSNYIYPDYSITKTEKPVVGYNRLSGEAVTDMKYFSTKATSVNLYRINYNFVNGQYHETTYDAAGEVNEIKASTADQSKIPTINFDKTADVRYYTQLSGGYALTMDEPSDWAYNYTNYYTESGGTYTPVAADATTPTWTVGTYYYEAKNKILNPLKEIYYVSAGPTTTYYSLAKNNTSWSAWKLESTSGTTVYTLDATSPTPKPDQVLIPSTTVAVAAKYPNPNTGFQNLDLFAVYATTVEIYNPADYAILDSDVLIFKSTASDALGTAAVQVASIDESNTFKVNNDGTGGYKFVYFAVRNSLYTKIKLSIKDATSGLRYDVTGTKTKVFDKADRYVLLTSEPADWSTNYAAYYTKAGRVFTAITGGTAPTFEANKYYYKATYAAADKEAQFTYFEIPVATEFAPGSVYTVTISGYTKKSTITPFTYPITMNIINSATATYSPTTFEPMDYATTKGSYFKPTNAGDSTAQSANDNATWKAGSANAAVDEVWQKD